MREDICTIPISEVFEPKDGCPICRMRNLLENRMIDYILGAAMMEPDVRIETNKKGFCREHFEQMLKQKGRLQLALILDSHIEEIKASTPGKLYDAAERLEKSCFVCEKIEWGFERMISSIYRLYETESDFRRLFNEQPHFCLVHYKKLMENGTKKTMRRWNGEFAENLHRITANSLALLHSDIKHFCTMFDYRSEGNDWGNSRDAIERSIEFLTSREQK
ncbi:MAG: DUF6062 family protein [Oscillospiraceae bacterium]